MSHTPPSLHEDRRRTLKADCSQCVGLCCVALAYAKSADFGYDKPAGEPCVNLQDDFRCGIHPNLRERGFKGCTTFDCFGAGQKVTQTTFGGRNWRDAAETRGPMFAVFPVMRQLHEMLWYLEAARAAPQAAPLYDELDRVRTATELLTTGSAESILALDVAAHRQSVNAVLARGSELVRAGAHSVGTPPVPKKFHPGADLIGASARGIDLRGANLRGALFIATDLRDTDLSRADVLGADFRDARVGGSNLSETLYLTQFQVNAAIGDAATRLPFWADRPAHWADAA
ncbi:pentapeptide repeat-containing protein [Rathayibacter soli]|uniref:pentapeptide repeat-containing protein n=1 Tax=Rathayibacter soli TaxID=3144168 RepID=UPI0027E4AE16|nr:pentapeptide repeat-containing protein [Glaciibacter superstes]